MEHSQLGQVIILQSEYTLCGAMLLNSILGGRRHITPCLNEQSEAELSEFISTVRGPPAPVWLCLTLQEPTPVSSEPVQISHPSECTTARETMFVREA